MRLEILNPIKLECCEAKDFYESREQKDGTPITYDCLYCGKAYTIYQLEQGVRNEK